MLLKPHASDTPLKIPVSPKPVENSPIFLQTPYTIPETLWISLAMPPESPESLCHAPKTSRNTEGFRNFSQNFGGFQRTLEPPETLGALWNFLSPVQSDSINRSEKFKIIGYDWNKSKKSRQKLHFCRGLGWKCPTTKTHEGYPVFHTRKLRIKECHLSFLPRSLSLFF